MRSRKSAADLAIVPLSGGGRAEPPADLDATEQSIWKAVVDASRPLAIDPAAHKAPEFEAIIEQARYHRAAFQDLPPC